MNARQCAPVDTEFMRRHYAQGPTAYTTSGAIAKMPTGSDVAYCEQQFDEWLARHDDEVRASVDWRVLGGLVPGVVNAAWLRDGDRVRLNELEGTVHLHTVSPADAMARFVFVTETGGQVTIERSLESEVHVLAPAKGDAQ